MNQPMRVTRSLIATLLCIMLSATAFSADFPAESPEGPKTVQIRLRLNSADPINVRKAPLKYNKHAAFSFTLDDGYRSAFLCAYPLLNGGRISPPYLDEWNNDEGGDGSNAKGLYYTDGCGHDIPFRLGLAINAASLSTWPLNRGHLSWEEVKTMYTSGWDLLNHSFHHSTKHGTDYEAEVLENNEAVEQKLGMRMTQFVVPGGESDPGYDMEYTRAAFKHHLVAVATNSGPGPVMNVDQAINLNRLIFQREFLKSNGDTDLAMDRYLRVIEETVARPETTWYNAFSHGVGNSNLWGISMVFKDFKYYMTAVAERHGREGADDLWMAPWQEVYEYLWLRDHTGVSFEQHGRDVIIRITFPELPLNMRHHALSLVIEARSGFGLISKSPALEVSHNGKGKHDLLNVRWNK